MPKDPAFQRELEAFMARRNLRQADVVRLTGVSQAWINSMVRSGKVPWGEPLTQLVAGRDGDPGDRARLFPAAGYSDVEVVAASLELPPAAVELARGAARLSPEDLALVRRLIDEPQRLHGLRLLI